MCSFKITSPEADARLPGPCASSLSAQTFATPVSPPFGLDIPQKHFNCCSSLWPGDFNLEHTRRAAFVMSERSFDTQCNVNAAT